MEKLDLLLKPSWDYKDIKAYLGVSTSQANKIKNRAIKECDGAVLYGSNLVKTDSVLQLYGTTRDKEISILKEIAHDQESL